MTRSDRTDLCRPRDIGYAGAIAFQRGPQWLDGVVPLAGDALTPREIDAVFVEELGHPVTTSPWPVAWILRQFVPILRQASVFWGALVLCPIGADDRRHEGLSRGHRSAAQGDARARVDAGLPSPLSCRAKPGLRSCTVLTSKRTVAPRALADRGSGVCQTAAAARLRTRKLQHGSRHSL